MRDSEAPEDAFANCVGRMKVGAAEQSEGPARRGGARQPRNKGPARVNPRTRRRRRGLGCLGPWWMPDTIINIAAGPPIEASIRVEVAPGVPARMTCCCPPQSHARQRGVPVTCMAAVALAAAVTATGLGVRVSAQRPPRPPPVLSQLTGSRPAGTSNTRRAAQP